MGESPFRENLDENLDRIRSTVRKLARGENEQNDMFQECCARILAKEGSWQGKAPFLHWLSRVARNTILDMRCGEVRKARREVSMEGIDPPAAASDPDAVVSEEQVRHVMGQFARLSERQRTILQMKYFQNRRTGDIAEELGISPSAVANEVDRALTRLRRRAGVPAWVAVFLPWTWDWKGWFSGEAAAASSQAASIGGIAMKGKGLVVVAAGTIVGAVGVVGYQHRESVSEREDRFRTLEAEAARAKEALAAAEKAADRMRREKEAALAAQVSAEAALAAASSAKRTPAGPPPETASSRQVKTVSPVGETGEAQARNELLQAFKDIGEFNREMAGLSPDEREKRKWELRTKALPIFTTLQKHDALIEGELFADFLAIMSDSMLPDELKFSTDQRDEVRKIALDIETRRQQMGLPRLFSMEHSPAKAVPQEALPLRIGRMWRVLGFLKSCTSAYRISIQLHSLNICATIQKAQCFTPKAAGL